jgi:hypothetical protein
MLHMSRLKRENPAQNRTDDCLSAQWPMRKVAISREMHDANRLKWNSKMIKRRMANEKEINQTLDCPTASFLQPASLANCLRGIQRKLLEMLFPLRNQSVFCDRN